MCKIVGIARSAYYKWLNRPENELDKENLVIIDTMIQLYNEFKGIYGYRRMKLNINRILGKKYNNKRIYRLMKCINMKSVIRKKKKSYVQSTPLVTAGNILDRKFHADSPNRKWLTDVTEFKLANGTKAYLSAILDLYDNSIIAYVLGRHNNNALVFKTFDKAVEDNPNASPLFHSDRGIQYTNKIFREKLDGIGATQSMSRVNRCIDNGPMEGFWGIIKAEMYYLQRFYHFDELHEAIDRYMTFYNTRRLQEKLGALTPLEYRNRVLIA